MKLSSMAFHGAFTSWSSGFLPRFCRIFSCPKSSAQQGTIVGVCCSTLRILSKLTSKQSRRSTKTWDRSDGNREYRVLMTTGWASPKMLQHRELKVFKTMLQQFAHGLVYTISTWELCHTRLTCQSVISSTGSTGVVGVPLLDYPNEVPTSVSMLKTLG